MMYETVTACNPDDPNECVDMDCTEEGYCCVEDVGCLDCSDADRENFDPEDCVEDDFMFLRLKEKALVFCDESESRCIDCNARTGHCCL